MSRHKPRRDCQVPSVSAIGTKPWRCPDCGTRRTFDPNAGKGADLWHGRDNVRNPDGSKPTTTFWDWLTT